MSLPTTDKDIANMALANLGHTVQIADLALDNTTEAKYARMFLDSERIVCLSEYRWRWAEKLVALVEVAAPSPLTDWWHAVREDWDHVYTLPADCVQPRALYASTRNPRPEDAVPFAQRLNEGGTAQVILTDEDPVTTAPKAPLLHYTWLQTDVTKYPQPFVRFFAWDLAVHLAKPVIGGDEGKRARDDAVKHRVFAFHDAWAFDARSYGPDQKPVSPSLAARGVSR